MRPTLMKPTLMKPTLMKPTLTQTLRQRLLSHFHLLTLVVFLTVTVLEGLIRFVLAGAGLSPLIYLPKGLIALSLLLTLLTSALAGRINRAFITVIGLALFTLVLGVLNVRAIVPVLFGVWVILPFFFGITVYPLLKKRWRALRGVVFVLWALATVGVLLNSQIDFPWVGFEFQLAGVSIVGSRQWATFDVSRLAGFSRVSIAAASHIVLLGLWLLAAGVKRYLALGIVVLSAVALYLTTMKTVTAVFLLLSLFVLLRPYIPKPLWVSVPGLAALLGFVLPFSTLLVDYQLEFDHPVSRFLFASFGIRLSEVWPMTLELVSNYGRPLLGRGIGGIGGAQQYFEPLRYSPADNLMLYLYVLGGVLFVGLLFVYAFSAVKLAPTRQRFDAFVYMMMVTVLVQGVTGNVMESAFFSLFFGVSLRHVLGLSALRMTHKRTHSAPTVNQTAAPLRQTT